MHVAGPRSIAVAHKNYGAAEGSKSGGKRLFNLRTSDYCEVNDSIKWITSYLGLNPIITYTGGTRGWIGDNPFIFLDTSRIRALGWEPKLTIREGVERTIAWLTQNRWVLDRRD
jgi:UDP-glucose 4-epimerase